MLHVDDGQLHAYLDGESELAARGDGEAVEAHLAVCPACRDRLEEARTLRDAAYRLLAAAVPADDAPPSFHSIAARARRQDPARAGFRRSVVGGAWAASILLALGAGWFAREAVFVDRGAAPAAPPTALAEPEPGRTAADPGAPAPAQAHAGGMTGPAPADAGAPAPADVAANIPAGGPGDPADPVPGPARGVADGGSDPAADPAAPVLAAQDAEPPRHAGEAAAPALAAAAAPAEPAAGATEPIRVAGADPEPPRSPGAEEPGPPAAVVLADGAGARDGAPQPGGADAVGTVREPAAGGVLAQRRGPDGLPAGPTAGGARVAADGARLPSGSAPAPGPRSQPPALRNAPAPPAPAQAQQASPPRAPQPEAGTSTTPRIRIRIPFLRSSDSDRAARPDAAFEPAVCSPPPFPAYRRADVTYFVGRATPDTVSAGAGTIRYPGRADAADPAPLHGQLVRVDAVGGGPGAAAVEAALATGDGRVVVVPWAYDPACQPAPWYGSARFVESPEPGFYTARLRHPDDWAHGRPTLDALFADLVPYPHGHDYRTDVAELTAGELMAFYAALPERDAFRANPAAAAATAWTWESANPELAIRQPAAGILAELRAAAGR